MIDQYLASAQRKNGDLPKPIYFHERVALLYLELDEVHVRLLVPPQLNREGLHAVEEFA